MALAYRDYKPIRQGNPGWTPKLEKARWYYSPTQEPHLISLRQFQTAARGNVSYEKFAKEREKQGIFKKKYRQRKAKIPAKPPPKPKPSPIKKKPTTQKKAKPTGKRKILNKYNQRALFLKNKWAEKVSENYGYKVSWDEMPSIEKTDFWQRYHDLVDRQNPPSKTEYEDYYHEFFDMEYEEVLDLSYGDTP